jgi:hypothetical protein
MPRRIDVARGSAAGSGDLAIRIIVAPAGQS